MSRRDAIAIFVRFAPGTPAPPASWPLGRAALELGAQGHRIVFCQPTTAVTWREERLLVTGQVATTDGWRPVTDQAIGAAYLRVSALTELRRLVPLAKTFQQAGVPLCNPLSLVSLCRDKLSWDRAAHRAGLPFPPSVTDLADMERSLRQWGEEGGGGVVKPRLGACGRDVVRIRLDGDVVWLEEAGPVRELAGGELSGWLGARQAQEPQLLQREVIVAPGPWRGLSIRSLVQRLPSGSWTSCPSVVRVTTDGIAGNYSRGAEVTPLDSFPHSIGGRSGTELSDQVVRLDQQVTRAIDAELGLAAPLALEVGIDYVPDGHGELHGIEVNDTPQGRLAIVADGDGTDLVSSHRAALRRPLDYLLAAAPQLDEACRQLRTEPVPTLP
ncbi:MAG: hypothetical protein JRI68_12895 [Deltaproteobacteria bacterium]|nr:hypothetical protein [Deltaproteobacteria bacterium]